jgi:phenylpropionate dioxygenase-like ring-hydroxylating dioxygenase large terminal subunit
MLQTLPWAWYADPETLRREQERIFRSQWQYVGHVGQLPDGGSFCTADVGMTPVVLTRAREDEELRAFVNICRHRGFPVAEGEGRRATLQCAYHAWTYGLDGCLLSAPRSDAEPGFDKERLGLAQVQVDTWGPFVFVNVDADAPPLADALGDMPELVAEILDVNALRFRHRVDWEVEANWKVVCENFLECYHCQVAHPSFSDVVDVGLDAYRLESSGLVSSQFGPVRDDASEHFDVAGEIARSQFHFLWPNTGINIFPGRANVSIGPINPLGAGRTARFLDYFFAPDTDERWIAEFLEFDDQVGKEDRVLVEGVQRGMEAGALPAGVVLERSESLIRHFQELTAAALS